MEKNVVEQNTENISFISKSEQFIEKHQKMLIGIVIGILVIVLGFFGIKKFVIEPRQEKANIAIFAPENAFGQAIASSQNYMAEQAMTEGQFKVALYGDSTSNNEYYRTGLLKVIDKYGSTKAGNRAKYMAGICFLHLGQYQEAVKYLDDYSAKDQLTPAFNEMLLGDAEAELGNNDAALKHYAKSIEIDDNPLSASFCLFKSGIIYLKFKNDKEKALECFQTIKKDYPESPFYSEMDGYIALAQNS